MIKKLHKRFIIIMMSLITMVLIVTFSSLIVSSASKMKSESLNDLDSEYSRISQLTLPKDMEDFDMTQIKPNNNFISPFDGYSHFSTFFATVDDSGNIEKIDDFSRNLSTEMAELAVEEALSFDKTEGVLKDLNLRYKYYTSNGKTIIGFVDISYERSFISQQIFNYGLIGIGSLVAFFVISLILSSMAIRPLDKAWKKQQQFVADASHELKTPITVMLANTSILLSEKDLKANESQKWISNIDSEARHMKKLVEDLLFLARVDAKDTDKMMSEIDLSDTTYQSILPFEAVMFESGKEIELDIESGISILGNTGQIKQLISILLDNARKYSYKNTSITVALHKEDSKAVLKVTNQSDPIPQEEIQYIFDRFYKVNKARTRDTNSYGLGLAIAKEIVLVHKGKIQVKSDKKNGTEFSIVFPTK